MPEAITYYDMRRRAIAAIPTTATFKVEVLERNFGKNCLINYTKMSTLHTKTFTLKGSDIVHHGKALFIPVWHVQDSPDNQPEQIWMRVQLFLHGHVVPVSWLEAQELKNPLKDNPPYALLLISNQSTDNSSKSLALVDRNKLTTVRFFPYRTSAGPLALNGSASYMCPHPCTMTQFKLWSSMILNHTATWMALKSKVSIWVYMLDHQDLFNGIGTSHLSEILHIAEEHPATQAKFILPDPYRRQNLIDAVKTFYDKAFSKTYIRRVSATSNGSAFYESPGTTRYINQTFHNVYGKTITGTLISIERYDRMVNAGLLEPQYQRSDSLRGNGRAARPGKSKHVRVYAVQLRKTRGIAFTCIYWDPNKAQNIDKNPSATVLSLEVAKGKATTGNLNRAEIGIASFMDTKDIEKTERYSTYRRFPFRPGVVGRPRLTKRLRRAQVGEVGTLRKKIFLGLSTSEMIPQVSAEQDNETVNLAEEDAEEREVQFGNHRVIPVAVISGQILEVEEDNASNNEEIEGEEYA